MKLTFYGATETVTGSRFLLEHGGARILIDCGLFQGLKKLRLKNWEPFPVKPSSIDAVLLTHAHIDHSGFLPALMLDDFRGKIYCTHATRDLASILLPDSGHLQEEEARYANKAGYSKHSPALPLYTADDGAACLRLFESVDYHEEIALPGGLRASFSRAGHILGSACIRIASDTCSVLFTGDLGRPSDAIMMPPEPFPSCDYLVTESTYGNRNHPSDDPQQLLVETVNRTIERGGIVLIPAFAVGRSQSILHLLADAKRRGQLRKAPIFLNSPMAINATKIFWDNHDESRLSDEEVQAMFEIATHVNSPEQSKALNARRDPMIIISASGMASGGRIVHHLKAFVGDPKNCVIFVGFQAAGTRGAAMLDGAAKLKIHGDYHRVHAEIVSIGGLSVHADQSELIAWMRAAEQAPKRSFIVHGEPGAQDALRLAMQDELGWQVSVPSYGDSFLLD